MHRNAYAYPAIGLKGGSRHCKFPSDSALEHHHRRLLRSFLNEKVVSGYLSVIYWGHYSGANGRTRQNFALAKVRKARDGIARHRLYVPGVIRHADRLIQAGDLGKALKHLTMLPQLGVAFASKICAFLSPERCGVIDSVIVEKYPQFDFEIDGKGYVRNTRKNVIQYAKYCKLLGRKAADLNSRGLRFRWRDRDRKTYIWRAVDAERAMYCQIPSFSGLREKPCRP